MQEKKKPSALREWSKVIVLGLAWLFTLYLVFVVSTTKIEQQMYDPYAILGIDSGSTEKEIKKRFKRLSIQFHPDKAGNSEEATEKFVEILKAYNSLTDPIIRANWEEHGNPDGIKSFSLGIALPKWLISPWFLFMYCVVLGVLLPIYVRNWWNRSKNYTKDGILHSSMGYYYNEMKEGMNVKKLLDILSNSLEFKEFKVTDEEALSLFQSVKSKVSEPEKSKRLNNRHALKAASHLYSHLFRISNDSKDQLFVVEKCLHLLMGMTQISVARDWIQTTHNCIKLSQMLTQATFDTALLQLPHFESVLPHCRTKKRNVTRVQDFLALKQEDREMLLQNLSPNQVEDIMNVANSIPSVQIKKVSARVLGHEEIACGGLVTLEVFLQVDGAEDDWEELEEDNLDIDEDGEVSKKTEESKVNLNVPVHAPFLPFEKKPFWWVTVHVQNANSFLLPPIKVHFLTSKKVKLMFRAPSKPSVVSLVVNVKSDSFIGFDVESEVKFQAVDVKHEQIADDFISEDEQADAFDDASGIGQ